MATATQTPAVAGTRTHDCPEFGHELGVLRRGRHRIYFELGEGKTGASAS